MGLGGGLGFYRLLIFVKFRVDNTRHDHRDNGIAEV